MYQTHKHTVIVKKDSNNRKLNSIQRGSINDDDDDDSTKHMKYEKKPQDSLLNTLVNTNKSTHSKMCTVTKHAIVHISDGYLQVK